MSQQNVKGSDAELRQLYDKLREPNHVPPSHAPSEAPPSKFSPDDGRLAAGYSIRVAQASTFDQFKEFVVTGISPVPVKMSPAEMEVLMGGGPVANWVRSAAWVAGAVAAWACADV